MTRTVLVLVTDQTNTPVADAIVIAVLDRYDIDVVTGQWISPVQHQYRTDENGEVTMSLWPNTAGERNSRYKVTAMTPNGRILFDVIATVPDVDGSLLSEIADAVSLDAELNPTNQSISYVQAQVMVADALADYKRKRIPGRGTILDSYGAYTITQEDEGHFIRVTGAELPVSPETETIIPVYIPQLEEGTIVDLIHADGEFAKVVLVAGQGLTLWSSLDGVSREAILLSGRNKKARIHWLSSGIAHVDGGIEDSYYDIMKVAIATIPSAGTTIVIQMTAPVESANPGAGFSVIRYIGGDGEPVPVAITSAAIGDPDTYLVILTIEQIYQDDFVLLSYDKEVGDIAAGSFELQSITNQVVQNGSTATP